MNAPNHFKSTAVILLILAIISLAVKAIPVSKHVDDFYAEEMYNVSYQYFFRSAGEGETKIKAYLPKNNAHQRITDQESRKHGTLSFRSFSIADDLLGHWTTAENNNYESIEYSFTYKGKSRSYQLPSNFVKAAPKHKTYLIATAYIQSDNVQIEAIASKLEATSSSDEQLVGKVFDFVRRIPSAPIITLTDAVTALEQNRASCNGKSRVFVALMRNLGYPARIKGGIILEDADKRTTHVWAEVNINDVWVPFDTLNGHFAYLPANYLELYTGDEFMITHTAGIDFDYTYVIKKQNNIPFLNLNAQQFSGISPISLWGLVEGKLLSIDALILLLMLPIGGLVVAFLRNVVGLRTFGVFLPVLIAYSLLETGFLTGLLLFVFLILFVGIVSRLFNRLGLLYTPKLVISLTIMVLVMVIGSCIGMVTDIKFLTALTFFPTIIITVSAERFSSLILEDGFQKATGTLFQTLVAVAFCYVMLSSKLLASIIIVFPELLLITIVCAMFLGRYIGLRATELLRFKLLFNTKAI